MPMSEYFKQIRAKIGHQLMVAPSVTGIVYDEKNRILLLRHSEGNVWVAPGGSVEPNEDPVDTVIREVWEEAGLQVELYKILGVFGGKEFEITYRNGDQVTYVMTAYACKTQSGILKADGVETLQAGYFSKEEIMQLSTPPWIPVILPCIFGNFTDAYFRKGNEEVK